MKHHVRVDAHVHYVNFYFPLESHLPTTDTDHEMHIAKQVTPQQGGLYVNYMYIIG